MNKEFLGDGPTRRKASRLPYGKAASKYPYRRARRTDPLDRVQSMAFLAGITFSPPQGQRVVWKFRQSSSKTAALALISSLQL